MTTISDVSYKDGRVIAADSKVSIWLDDYAEDFKKIVQIPGTNVIVQMAGDLDVAMMGIQVIRDVLAKYPNDDLDAHIADVNSGLRAVTAKLKDDANRGASLLGQPPEGRYATLLVSMNSNGAVKTFKTELGMDYVPKPIFKIKDPDHMEESVELVASPIADFIRLGYGESVAVGPDPRSQMVLDEILKNYPDYKGRAREDAVAINYALIQTFIDKNKGVGWPVYEWDVNGTEKTPTLLHKSLRPTDMDKATNDYVKSLLPVAYAAFEVVTLKLQVKMAGEEEKRRLKKLDDAKNGVISLSKEDEAALKVGIKELDDYVSKSRSQLDIAQDQLASEEHKLSHYLAERNAAAQQSTVKAKRGADKTKSAEIA